VIESVFSASCAVIEMCLLFTFDIALFVCFVQALEEALQTSQPLGGSSETLQDIWKHQVSFHQQRPLEFWGNFLKRTPKTFQDVEKKKPVNPSGAT